MVVLIWRGLALIKTLDFSSNTTNRCYSTERIWKSICIYWIGALGSQSRFGQCRIGSSADGIILAIYTRWTITIWQFQSIWGDCRRVWRSAGLAVSGRIIIVWGRRFSIYWYCWSCIMASSASTCRIIWRMSTFRLFDQFTGTRSSSPSCYNGWSCADSYIARLNWLRGGIHICILSIHGRTDWVEWCNIISGWG